MSFNLGTQLKVIAGQNSAQKTTLLGMLTRMFTLDPQSAKGSEKPLIGGNYRSDFTNKFKFLPTYDRHLSRLSF